MVSMNEVEAAVDSAKEMLSESGVDLDVTADQLWEYFETDLPVPDISLGEVILNPLLVVHELVEIDEVLKMGLRIGNIEKWTVDKTLSEGRKADYRRLLAEAKEALSRLRR
ncbi:MAG: hypothetical protein MUC90_03040 [Thermoplasmata archaeon]|nr:hypothetical protein [Thermoplasmata archaeon]